MATSVAEAAYCAALKGGAEATGFPQSHLGERLDNFERRGSLKRGEQPYPSHGGQVLVAAGHLGGRRVGMEDAGGWRSS